MRKSRLGLVLLILLLLIGGSVGVYFMLLDDSRTPVPQARAADIEPTKAGEPVKPLTDNSQPDSPVPAHDRDPKPDPKPEPDEKPNEKPVTGPEAHGFPKPRPASAGGDGDETQSEAIFFGTVLDQDGNPVGGAAIVGHIVEIWKGRGHGITAATISGSYENGQFSVAFKYGHDKGVEHVLAVYAEKDGYYLGTVAANDPDNPVELRLIALSDDTKIEGDVVYSDGTPAADQRVYCTGQLPQLDADSFQLLPTTLQDALSGREAKTWKGEASTDEFGHFVLGKVPPGSVTVWVGRKQQKSSTDVDSIEVFNGRTSLLARPLTIPLPAVPLPAND